MSNEYIHLCFPLKALFFNSDFRSINYLSGFHYILLFIGQANFFFHKGINQLLKIISSLPLFLEDIIIRGPKWTLEVFLFIYLFIYLFMAVLGLRFCARAFSSCGEQGPFSIAVRGPLTIAASLVAEHRLQTRGLSSCGSRA